MACTVGIDADTHPLQWHEHRAGPEPVDLDRAGECVFAGRQQIWVLHHLFCIRGLHCDLPLDGDILSARDEGEDTGGN